MPVPRSPPSSRFDAYDLSDLLTDAALPTAALITIAAKPDGTFSFAVALVDEAKAEGRTITDDDLDGIRNVCRCGTYPRIRQAIEAGAAKM